MVYYSTKTEYKLSILNAEFFAHYSNETIGKGKLIKHTLVKTRSA